MINPGKAWAYTGVALGATVSVAANIAHSYVTPEGASEDWSPETGAVIGASFWPLALAVSSEVLARNAWAGRRKVLGIGGVVIVAAVAAVVSYLHLKGLLTHYGEPGLTATIGPLSVDGLMLTSTVALIGSERSDRVAPQIASAGGTSRPSVEALGRPDRSVGQSPDPIDWIDPTRQPIHDPTPGRSAQQIQAPDLDDESGRAETRSETRSDANQSTRSSSRSKRRGSGRRSGGQRSRSDGELWAELEQAIELGFVDREKPTADAIRVALQCAPGKSRQLRDALAKPAAGEASDA